MKRFYISDGTRKIGPYSADEIAALVFACKLSLVDQVFDARTKEWVFASEVGGSSKNAGFAQANPEVETRTAIGLPQEGLSEPDPEGDRTKTVLGLLTTAPTMGEARAKKTPPKPLVVEADAVSSPTTISAPDAQQVKWYLREGRIILGPYSFAAMLGMIIDGTIREHDFIRQTNETSWTAAKDCEAFAVERLKQVTSEEAAKFVARGGFRRRHARKDVNERVVVHARGALHHIQMGDISIGGCSLLVNMPLFRAGEEVYLSIFEDDEAAPADSSAATAGTGTAVKAPRFNAKAEIVGVFPQAGAGSDGEVFKHSVRFLAVTRTLMEKIKLRLVG